MNNNNDAKKELRVSAIKNGTVLDHIPDDVVLKVVKILGLHNHPHPVTIGISLDSKTMGKKGIIKIAEKFFEDGELNKIALVAPNASVNIIRDYEVIEKKVLTIPKEISGIARCINPVCVTNHEDIETRFYTIVKDSEILLKCHYCEKITDSKNLKIVSNNL